MLAAMFGGMGDEAVAETGSRAGQAVLHHRGLRIVRGLDGDERSHLLACWTELWRGAVHSCRQFMQVEVADAADGLAWTITPREVA